MIAESLEVFGEEVKRIVERIGRKFQRSNDDWESALILEHAEGRSVYALSPELYNGEDEKVRLAAWMGSLIEKKQATRFAWVVSTWQIAMKPGQSEAELEASFEPYRGRLGEHPDSFEAVLLEVADFEREIVTMAKIERHPGKPPTLGEWTRFDTSKGRFTAMREALRR